MSGCAGGWQLAAEGDAGRREPTATEACRRRHAPRSDAAYQCQSNWSSRPPAAWCAGRKRSREPSPSSLLRSTLGLFIFLRVTIDQNLRRCHLATEVHLGEVGRSGLGAASRPEQRPCFLVRTADWILAPIFLLAANLSPIQRFWRAPCSLETWPFETWPPATLGCAFASQRCRRCQHTTRAMQAAPSLRLDSAGLVAEGAALVQDLGQAGTPLQLQHVLTLVSI